MNKLLTIAKSQQAPRWLLRGGLAFVFLYAAVASLMQPYAWAGFLPEVLRARFSPVLLIDCLAVYELVLVVGLLVPKTCKYAAGLAGLTLLGILVSNPSQMITTFRDVGLLFGALALVSLELQDSR